jgi:hypothetical protein
VIATNNNQKGKKHMISLNQLGTASTLPTIATKLQLWKVLVGMISLGLCFPATNVRAQSFIVDQSNTNFDPRFLLYQNIEFFSPIGQEFTPTLTSLNTVELVTENFDGAEPSTLLVNIRQGTITAPIIGTSLPITIPSGSFGSFSLNRFDFPSAVPLVPGSIFIIQVVPVLGGDRRGIGSTGGPLSTYPGGNQILGGVPQPNNDLWFEEGITSIPEPSLALSILAFGTFGAISMLKRIQKSVH